MPFDAFHPDPRIEADLPPEEAKSPEQLRMESLAMQVELSKTVTREHMERLLGYDPFEGVDPTLAELDIHAVMRASSDIAAGALGEPLSTLTGSMPFRVDVNVLHNDRLVYRLNSKEIRRIQLHTDRGEAIANYLNLRYEQMQEDAE